MITVNNIEQQPTLSLPTHQRPLKAGGIVETPAHDQKRSLLIQLIGDGLNLLIQCQHLLYQLWQSKKKKSKL